MEKLGSGTEVNENTGCAGPGSETKKVYKSQIDSTRFKINSKQEKQACDDSQNTDQSNTNKCSSSPQSKRKSINKQTFQTGNIKENHNNIENTFLYKIPDDKLRNFYKYQFYNFSLQEKKTEWDTIMIVPEYSAILNIEVKRGSNDSSDKLKLLKDASDQTKQHFSFIHKLFGGMLSKDWVFVRAACVPYLTTLKETTVPCVHCQPFILQDKNVKQWFKQLIEHNFVTSDNYDQAVYENLVAELIYHISIKESSKFDKLVSDPLTLSRETEKALTAKSEGFSGDNDVRMYMLSNDQLQAVHSQAKCLIIDGDYGTGKTYVLKERAKKCAKNNSEDQLFYIDLTALSHRYNEKFARAESSVMNNIAVVDFDSYPNIKVITTKDLGISEDPEQTDIINSLNSFLRDNPCDHLFIDEMIIEEIVFPDSIETICVNLRVVAGGQINFRESFKHRKAWWFKSMKVNHNAVHVNLTKNMRNSQQILHLAKSLEKNSTQQMSCSPDTNVIGNHNFYYKNIYDIRNDLLVVAAVNKYFIHKPKESVVVLSSSDCYIHKLFEVLKKNLSPTIPVVRDFKAYMEKPEGILVTNMFEFQGAQARNIIICNTDRIFYIKEFRNAILRTMSFAIIILEKESYIRNSSGVIEDKNLHEFIYPELFFMDGFIDVKRNISRNYPDISWSYYHFNYAVRDLKDPVNRPRHINYIQMKNAPQKVKNFDAISELKNIIVFADKNIDHKHEFAARGKKYSLKCSDEEASIIVERSKEISNKSDAFCRDVIMLSQPKFVIVVHDGNIETFSLKGALNLIEDDNLHEHIPLTNTELSNQ